MDSSAEQLLKRALSASHFSEAYRLLPAYREEVISRLLSADSDQQRSEILGSFHNLLSLARVTRAHVATQLAAVQREACYQAQLPQPHSWHFEA